jgi:arsenate reductase (glutaredoxin)
LTVTLYGIPNCDTVKKARTWLGAQGIAHQFIDYKKAGAEREKLSSWVDALGWEKLLNRAGTTFRKLPDLDREGLDRARAIELMLAHPSCIKRPVVEAGEELLVGFDPSLWSERLV